MKIGIVGAGNVGGTLGKLWASDGHEVMFGVRATSAIEGNAKIAIEEYGAQHGSMQQAVDFGEIVVLALPGHNAAEVVKSLNGWDGKIVIDANNRFEPSQTGRSLAEDIAAQIPEAKVVKAFNTIGTNRYSSPSIEGQDVTMFICGDDDEAKAVVGKLAQDMGFDLVDVGDLSQAELVESLARLWVWLSRSGYGREIGFRLLRQTGFPRESLT